ncbi:hypothetical protein OT109_05255 [Phycisphaeraceae bacterium D3-23]
MSIGIARFLKIVVGTMLLSCVLGVALDLVTANVAVEYFSIHHPQVVNTKNPIVLAIIWGVGASWWFGALGGAALGFINHRRQVPLAPGCILRWVVVACVVLWVIMITIVVGVYVFAGLIPDDSRGASFEHDRRLMAVALAHQTEYVLGAVAVVAVGIMTWRSKRLFVESESKS